MKKTGYTFLETAMVLIIISFILSTLILFSIEKSNSEKVKETNRILDVIEKALAQYLIKNRSMPCPSIITQSQFSSAANEFGFSYRGASNNSCTNSFGVSNGVVAGGVPIRTLLIDDYYAFDAWGNRIIYAMPQTCAANDISNWTGYFNGSNFINCTSNISILTESGASISKNPIYVLVSTGQSANSGYSHTGTQFSASGDNNENENTNMDYIFVSKQKTSTFDDIVRFKSKEDYILDAGGILYQTLPSTSQYNYFNICYMLNNSGLVDFSATRVVTPNTGNASSLCSFLIDNISCYTDIAYFAAMIARICF